MIAECTPQPAPPASEKPRFFRLRKDLASRQDIPPAAKLVAAAIEDHAGQNAEAWPGVALLARECGLGRSTVIRAIVTLERSGWLAVNRTGAGKRNLYRIEAKPVSKCDQSQNDTSPKMTPEPVSECDQNRYQNETLTNPVTNRDSKKPCRRARRRTAEKAPPDPRVAEAMQLFCRVYREALGRTYTAHWGRDGRNLKLLLAALDAQGTNGQTMTAIERRARAMLADNFGRVSGDVPLLWSKWDCWGILADGGGKTPAQQGRGQPGNRGILPAVEPTREFPRGLDFSKPQGAVPR